MTWLNENQGAIMALLTAVYCITTILILWANYRVTEEMRFTREIQFRPFVIPDVEIDSERGTVHFVLRNAGAGIASNVRINIDPPIENPKKPTLNIGSIPLIQRGLKAMVPGKEYRTLIGVFGDFPEQSSRQHRVLVSYEDIEAHRSYSTDFVVDIDSFYGIRPSQPKSIHSLVTQVEELNKQIKTLNGELRKRSEG